MADHITVPDPNLLYYGHYQHSGDDLKLVGDDGKTFVVHDYFKGDHRPTLFTPKGAVFPADLVEALAGPANPGKYAQATAPQASAEAIGRIVKVGGNTTIVRNGVAITLNVGDAVLKGDVVQTGSDGALTITFNDGTTFNLTADARMVLNEFVYDPNGSANSAFINILHGQVTFITGQLAKTGDMKVGTPVATMGIRGTGVFTSVLDEVKIAVIDRDGYHALVMYNPVTGAVIGQATNQNGEWRLTMSNNGQVVAQQFNLTAPQVAELTVTFNNLVASQAAGNLVIQQFQNAPAQGPTKNLDDKTDAQPQSTTHAAGTQIIPPDTTNLTLKITDNGIDTKGTGATTVTVQVTSVDQGPILNKNPIDTPLPQPFSITLPLNPAPFFVAPAETITRVAVDGEHSIGPRLNAGTLGGNDSGRYVVFIAADNLPSGNDLQNAGTYLYDRLTGTTQSLTLHLADGTTLHDGETFSGLPSISADGRYVVFHGDWQTVETGTDQGGQPYQYSQWHSEVFLYDNLTHTTRLLLADAGGDDSAISADGTVVATRSSDGYFDGTNNHNVQHILVADLNGVVRDDIYVDTIQNAEQGAFSQTLGSPALSQSGKFITFWTTVSSIDINADGESNYHFDLNANGDAQVYIYDLAHPDVAPVLVSGAGGAPGNGDSGKLNDNESWASSMSGDGQFVVFQSSASNLDPAHANSHENIFLYNTVTGALQQISVDNPVFADATHTSGDSFRPEISADGRYVAYISTASDLVANDNNGLPDVFIFDTLTGSTTLVSVAADGTQGDGDSQWGTTVAANIFAGLFVFAYGSEAINIVTPDSNNHADIFIVDQSTNYVALVRDDPNTPLTADDGVTPVLQANGTLPFSDDAGDSDTVSFVAVDPATLQELTGANVSDEWGQLISLSASPTPIDASTAGTIAYSYQVDESKLAGLAPGATHIDAFLVTITDSAGGKATAPLYITLVGTDVVTVDPSPLVHDPVTEDSAPVTVDFLQGAHSQHNYALSVINFVGTATDQDGSHPDVSGALSFSPDGRQVTIDPNFFNYLGDRQFVTLTAEYDVWDGYTAAHQTASITITGINGSPTVSVSPVVAPNLTEDDSPFQVFSTTLLTAAGASDPENDPLTIVNFAPVSAVDQNGHSIDVPTGTLTIALNGDGSLNSFTIDPSKFDYLAANQNVTLTAGFDVSDGHGGLAHDTAQITIIGVNDAPTALSVTNQNSIAENTLVETKIADISVLGDPDTDPAFNTYTFTTDDDRFTVHDGALYLKAGQSIDFETEPTIDVKVTATDTTADAFSVNSTVHVSITDINEAPTAVLLNNTVTSTPENGAAIKVANIAVTDDALGTNALSLSGADASSFSIQNGNELWFNGGANFEAKSSYAVTVNVDDATVGGTPDVSTNFTLAITDVNENAAPVLSLNHSENVQDQFNSAAYNLNTGSVHWATNWTETNDGGNSPTTGEILITNDPIVTSGNFRLKLSDLDSEEGAPDTVQRTANLGTATSAILTFDYRRDIPDGQTNDRFLVLVSSDGTNFTQIAAIGGGTFVDNHYLTASFDISAYISPTTTIRFSVGDDVDNGDIVYIDNVNIAYTFGTYVENGAGVAIAGTGSLITDPDNANMMSATITLTNAMAGDSLTVGSLPGGISSSIDTSVAGKITVTLTGPASKADYEAALHAVTFSNSTDNPDTTDRVINVVVNDGTADSNPAATTIHVTAVNDAPVIIAPDNLQYDPAGGDQTPFNRIMFADPDATGSVTVTMHLTNGDGTFILNGTPASGGAILQNSSHDVQITGTISAINAWLAADNLTLDSHGNDTDTYTISINDGTTTTSKTGFAVSDISPNFGGSSTNNLAGVNVFETSYDAGNNGDTIYTSWSHVGTSPTAYDGGSGSDTIYVIFTPGQLQQVLTDDAWRDDLQGFLSAPSGDTLSLGSTDWRATATNFETANIELADLFATRDDDNPANNYININTTWKSVITSAEIVGSDGDGNNNLVIASASGQTRSGGNGNDVLVATNGGNTLNGEAGNDLLLGGVGSDILNGGSGNDVLAGGAGKDTFVFNANFGNDKIADFELGQDIVQIDHTVFAAIADIFAHTADDANGNAVVTAGVNTITIQDISKNALHANDFHIV